MPAFKKSPAPVGDSLLSDASFERSAVQNPFTGNKFWANPTVSGAGTVVQILGSAAVGGGTNYLDIQLPLNVTATATVESNELVPIGDNEVARIELQLEAVTGNASCDVKVEVQGYGHDKTAITTAWITLDTIVTSTLGAEDWGNRRVYHHATNAVDQWLKVRIVAQNRSAVTTTSVRIGYFNVRRPISDQGTVFPTAPFTNQTFLRTDQMIEYYWSGSYWLSVIEFAQPLQPYTALPSNVSVSNTIMGLSGVAMPSTADSDEIMLTGFGGACYVPTTHNSTNHWQFNLETVQTATRITQTTSWAENATLGFWKVFRYNFTSLRTVSSDKGYYISAQKILSPGNLYYPPILYYRIKGD